METWSHADLVDAVGRLERELEEARLLPNSIRSYVDYSRRFVRWRNGDYRPRDAVGPERRPQVIPATVADLKRDLAGYEDELRAAGRQPAAVRTYVDHAARFIRWLDGRFVTGGPRGASSTNPRAVGRNAVAA